MILAMGLYDKRIAAIFVVALLAAAGAASAQQMLSAKAGLVYFVLGRMSIAGIGPLGIGPVRRQLKEGETLLSESGRAEVLLNAGTVLRIGDMTRIRMNSAELTDTRVAIEAGSAVVTVGEAPKSDRVEIRINGAVVTMKGPGMFRFDAKDRDADEPMLRVFGGQAEAYREEEPSPENAASKTVAKRGQALRLRDLQAGKFDTNDADALQQWAETRSASAPVPAPRPWCAWQDCR